jgi:hypothetical protein
VSPVRYELGFYIPEDGFLHSHRRENFESYIHNFIYCDQDEILVGFTLTLEYSFNENPCILPKPAYNVMHLHSLVFRYIQV